MFKSDKETIWNDDRDKFLEYMTNLCKPIISEKRKKEIKVKEGKESMSFSCYKLACELLVMEGTSEAIFLL